MQKKVSSDVMRQLLCIFFGISFVISGFLKWSPPTDSSSAKPEVIDYVNWHSQDALDHATGDCVQLLLSEDGRWRLNKCSDDAFFVCKKKEQCKSTSLIRGTSDIMVVRHGHTR